jgi:hypothetical protein
MENRLILTPAEEPQIERLRPIYPDHTSKDSGVYSAVSDFMSKKKGTGPKNSMDLPKYLIPIITCRISKGGS